MTLAPMHNTFTSWKGTKIQKYISLPFHCVLFAELMWNGEAPLTSGAYCFVVETCYLG